MTDNTPLQDAWLAEAERLIDLYGCACRAWSQGDRDEADKDVNKHHSALFDFLRTRPASPAVPPGWKLAPIEPTAAMLASVSSYSKDQLHAGLVYRAMLAASPAPAAQPAVPVQGELSGAEIAEAFDSAAPFTYRDEAFRAGARWAEARLRSPRGVQTGYEGQV